MNPPTYSVYGVRLATEHPLANRLLTVDGAPQVTYTDDAAAFEDIDWTDVEELYRSPYPLESGVPHQLIYRTPHGIAVRFSEVADFLVASDRISSRLLDESYRYVLEIHLLGTILSLWLELAGRPALHASAVVIGGRAAGLMAAEGGGKTTTAATLMGRGHALLADDILAVQRTGDGYQAHPGHPQMRMWPADADTVLGDHRDLDIVNPHFDKRRVPVGDGGFGTFHAEPVPLAALYRLERRTDPSPRPVEIESLSGAEATMELVEQSFTAGVIDRLGLAPRRLARFADLIADVPVRRVRFTPGPDRGAALADAVEADLERGAAA